MADRYQDRPFPADDPHARGESDPLAELARLIGQTDPFANMGRANQTVQPNARPQDSYRAPAEEPAAGPPPWMQRAARHAEPPQQDHPNQDYPSSVHPLQRYAAQQAAPEPDYQQQTPFADPYEHPDPSRYDDALYGQPDSGAQEPQHDEYAEDPYGYQDGYGEGAEEPAPKRRGGMTTVAVVLALSVVGVGAALAYRTYTGSARSGEPPIIRADSSPTKIIPAQTDGSSKVPDRLGAGDGTEKIVPREEAPMDVNAKSAAQSGPRVVFPPLNANNNPPSMASVSTSAPPPMGANGTMANSEPRKIKTLSVRGDQPDASALPITSTDTPAPTAVPTRSALAPKGAATAMRSPAMPPASSGNAPMSLVPQSTQAAPAVEPRTRVATTAPVQIAPAATSSGGGGYLVQVSSQRSENDAQASFRSLQGKFPSVLASRSPVIKRADLGEKGVYYRAMVGPFGSPDEASQLCGNLKAAGGQCVVQRN